MGVCCESFLTTDGNIFKPWRFVCGLHTEMTYTQALVICKVLCT